MGLNSAPLLVVQLSNSMGITFLIWFDLMMLIIVRLRLLAFLAHVHVFCVGPISFEVTYRPTCVFTFGACGHVVRMREFI